MLFVPFVPEVVELCMHTVYIILREEESFSLSSMLIFSQSLFFYHIALLFIMRKTRQKAIERGSHPLLTIQFPHSISKHYPRKSLGTLFWILVSPLVTLFVPDARVCKQNIYSYSWNNLTTKSNLSVSKSYHMSSM